MMRDYITLATIFIVAMGLLFIIVAGLLSVLFDFPTIMIVGMGIVGILLLFLPFTRDRYKQ